MKSDEVAIYTLLDPRDGRVRYVGESSKPDERGRSHRTMSVTSARVHGWIRELRAVGLAPVMEIVATVPFDGALDAEWLEIQRQRDAGADLLNVRVSRPKTRKLSPTPRYSHEHVLATWKANGKSSKQTERALGCCNNTLNRWLSAAFDALRSDGEAKKVA